MPPSSSSFDDVRCLAGAGPGQQDSSGNNSPSWIPEKARVVSADPFRGKPISTRAILPLMDAAPISGRQLKLRARVIVFFVALSVLAGWRRRVQLRWGRWRWRWES